MNYKYIAIAIGIIAITDLLLRISLFSLFQGKKVPKIITYLGNILPYCIMPILVLYCIRDTAWLSFASVIPVIIGLGATAVTHLIKKNTILSIIVGTACYMVFIRIL